MGAGKRGRVTPRRPVAVVRLGRAPAWSAILTWTVKQNPYPGPELSQNSPLQSHGMDAPIPRPTRCRARPQVLARSGFLVTEGLPAGTLIMSETYRLIFDKSSREG